MFTKILYIIVISIIIFLVSGLFLPRDVHVERAVVIARPASTVYTLVNSFNTISAWSPWSEKDPATEYRFSGPDSGVGARVNWNGDPRQVGSGWLEITDTRPWSRVQMKLDYDQLGRASTYFDLAPAPTGTRLTWGFDADLVEGHGFLGGLLARYFGLFFDQWVGTDFEQGLARLKLLAEALPDVDFSDLDVEMVEAEPMEILYVTIDGSQKTGDVAVTLAAAYQEISAFMAEHSIEMFSQPMAITRAWDGQDYQFSAAIPVVSTNFELTGNIRAGKAPAGRAVRVVHRGPYDRMAPSYEKLAAYMAVNGLKEGRVSWEHYISDPGNTPAGEIVTHIYFLVDGQ